MFVCAFSSRLLNFLNQTFFRINENNDHSVYIFTIFLFNWFLIVTQKDWLGICLGVGGLNVLRFCGVWIPVVRLGQIADTCRLSAHDKHAAFLRSGGAHATSKKTFRPLRATTFEEWRLFSGEGNRVFGEIIFT